MQVAHRLEQELADPHQGACAAEALDGGASEACDGHGVRAAREGCKAVALYQLDPGLELGALDREPGALEGLGVQVDPQRLPGSATAHGRHQQVAVIGADIGKGFAGFEQLEDRGEASGEGHGPRRPASARRRNHPHRR